MSAPAELQAARLLLARLGVTPEQLLDPIDRPAVPTFAEYIDQLWAAVPESTGRVYGPYWERVLRQWADRRLDEPAPPELTRLVELARRSAVVRRNSRGGARAR